MELYERNEDLIDLIKQLDEKMNTLEQFIIKELPDGEARLMEIINNTPKPSRPNSAVIDHSVKESLKSISGNVMKDYGYKTNSAISS